MTGVPSQAKRRAILEAATEAFLHSGYSASVDEIAAVAGVGKQTVYRHFRDKETLFLAAVAAARATPAEQTFTAEQTHTAASPPAAGPHTASRPTAGRPAAGDWVFPSGAAAETLTLLGEQILAAALSPTVAALHRLTIAEIGNHPELSDHWGDGAEPFVDQELAGYFRCCADAGLLDVPDPGRAARQFAYLLVTEGRMASAYGTKHLTTDQRHAIAVETADLLVRAYRPA